VVLTLAVPAMQHHTTLGGLALASVSGVVTSGAAYALWFAALRTLRAADAAILQLAVPVITAVLGVMLLGEELTARLMAGGATILGCILLAMRSRETRTDRRP
jgi:drug/metabolite transporter (DMT)-like permease